MQYMSDYYFMMLNQMVEFYRSLFTQGILSAIIILVIGGVVASGLSNITKKVVQKLGIDKSIEATGAKNLFKKSGLKFSLADMLGWLVKWFVIIFALMVAVDSLDMPQVSDFLTKILNYLPNLIGALAVLAIGLIVAQMVSEAMETGAKATGIAFYGLVAAASKWVIIAMTFLVVLEQIGIQTTVLQIFAGGISFMFALAGGLAFGLGGQYHAKELLDDIKNKIAKH